MKTTFLFSCFLLLQINLNGQNENEIFLITGTYTSGKSEGIYVHKFNTETAETSFISSVKTSNPSFLTVSVNQKFIYAVNENAKGQITSFTFDHNSGQLTQLNQQSSNGAHPCFITIDKSGKWIITGNYSSGTISINKILPDGSLAESKDSLQHIGHSIISRRQDGPHVHATVFSKNNKFLYVPDLGIDKVMIYTFKKRTGSLKEAKIPFVKTRPGSGPRHFEIAPNAKFAYLMEEMTGTVSVFKIQKNGSLKYLQSKSALPENFSGSIGSADIHISPDGKFLYCSNRGESNSIGIFSIDKQTGLITWIDSQSTLGRTPRNFNFDPTGNFLLVANQNSDQVVIFKKNHETGLLTDTGKRISIPNPVCIKWITTKQ